MTIYHKMLLKSKTYGGTEGWTRKVNGMSDQQAYAIWLRMRKFYHYTIVVKNIFDELRTRVHMSSGYNWTDDELLDDFVKKYPQFANDKLEIERIPDVPNII